MAELDFDLDLELDDDLAHLYGAAEFDPDALDQGVDIGLSIFDRVLAAIALGKQHEGSSGDASAAEALLDQYRDELDAADPNAMSTEDELLRLVELLEARNQGQDQPQSDRSWASHPAAVVGFTVAGLGLLAGAVKFAVDMALRGGGRAQLPPPRQHW